MRSNRRRPCLPLRFAAVALASAALWPPAAFAQSPVDDATARPRVIVVIGAPGTEEYATAFRNWADAWRLAAEKGGAEFTLLGADDPTGAAGSDADEQTTTPAVANAEESADISADNDAAKLRDLLADQAADPKADALWLVLIGHGTFDGDVAKVNLRGPDVSASQLAEWLKPIPAPVALIDCTSASAPLISAASGPNRVVITATKSGFELNFARFGKYLAEAINDPAADLDKDGQTSLLEAYLTACRGVVEFYAADQRLATEHALLDDNGDGLGTPAAWFRGIRAVQRAKEGAALDGLRAHQFHLVRSGREADMPRAVRERRDELELALAALRDKKVELGDEAYYAQLKPLLVEMAQLYADQAASDDESKAVPGS
jgi:hypothetical protein